MEACIKGEIDDSEVKKTLIQENSSGVKIFDSQYRGKHFILKSFPRLWDEESELEYNFNIELSKKLADLKQYFPQVINYRKLPERSEIWMEYGGENLSEIMVIPDAKKDYPDFPIATCICFPAKKITQLFSTLAYTYWKIHCTGNIHSDIKPANVLYNSDRQHFMIIDLGSMFQKMQQSLFETSPACTSAGDSLIRENTEIFSPPQIVNLADDLILSSFDTYCYGMTCYTVLLHKSMEELGEEYLEFKKKKYDISEIEYENKYKIFLKKIEFIRLYDDPMKKYSDYFIALLKMMLSYQERKRPSFKAIHEIFEGVLKAKKTLGENLKEAESEFSGSDLFWTLKKGESRITNRVKWISVKSFHQALL